MSTNDKRGSTDAQPDSRADTSRIQDEVQRLRQEVETLQREVHELRDLKRTSPEAFRVRLAKELDSVKTEAWQWALKLEQKKYATPGELWSIASCLKALYWYGVEVYGDVVVQRALKAEAQVETLTRQTRWQPIETAPKDGTFVLLWWPRWQPRQPTIGRFGIHGIQQWWAPEVLEWEGDGPTHWMPLPLPPSPDAPDH